MTLPGASLSEMTFDRSDAFHSIKMMTDSESCLGVLRNEGFSRRVRHLCISICFIQRLVASGLVSVAWIPTAESVAVIMTKILSKELTERHRKSLGICELTAPEQWQLEVITPKSKAKKKNEPNTRVSEVLEEFAVKPSPRSVFKNLLSDIEDDPTCMVVLIDICTSGRAGFAQIAGKIIGLRVVSVTSQTPIQTVSQLLKPWMIRLQKKDVKFCIWISPPCTGGSPIMNFVEPVRRAELVKRHFSVLVEILEHCDFAKRAELKALELSNACSFWKEPIVVDFIRVIVWIHQSVSIDVHMQVHLRQLLQGTPTKWPPATQVYSTN